MSTDGVILYSRTGFMNGWDVSFSSSLYHGRQPSQHYHHCHYHHTHYHLYHHTPGRIWFAAIFFSFSSFSCFSLPVICLCRVAWIARRTVSGCLIPPFDLCSPPLRVFRWLLLIMIYRWRIGILRQIVCCCFYRLPGVVIPGARKLHGWLCWSVIICYSIISVVIWNTRLV